MRPTQHFKVATQIAWLSTAACLRMIVARKFVTGSNVNARGLKPRPFKALEFSQSYWIFRIGWVNQARGGSSCNLSVAGFSTMICKK
jgi:hypothetical protein